MKKKRIGTQVFKAVRLPCHLVTRINAIAEEEGSTFSQFLRTAAIKELNKRKRDAA